MKTTVTLKRFYFKEVTVEVSKELLKGKTEEQIADFLIEDFVVENEDKLFEEAELYDLDVDSDGNTDEDTDRFDIYNDDGKQIYGGHL